jgi:hypothetical protein
MKLFLLFLLFLFLQDSPAQAYEYQSVTPPDNGVALTLNGDLYISFIDPVMPMFSPTWNNGDIGNISLIRLINGNQLFTELVEFFDNNSNRIGGHGTSVVTIDPTNNLLDNNCYYVTIEDCAIIINNTLNPSSSCPDSKDFLEISGYSWSFKTGSATCPWDPPIKIITENAQVLHVSPATNAKHIQKNQSLNIVFSKNVTKDAGNFVLKRYNDNSVIETISVDSAQITGWGTSSIIINPSVNFSDDTQYYVNMDLDNYRVEGNKDNWTFTIQKQPSVFSGSGL